MPRRSRFHLHIPRSPLRRLALMGVVALLALAFYYWGAARRTLHPMTEEAPGGGMQVDQERALGRQAVTALTRRHGGLHPDPYARRLIERVGGRLVARSRAGRTPYRFAFHLLADERTADAFAVPGGQILLTTALGARLRTEGEVAGVLAHLIGHVVERHTTRRIAAAQRGQGLPTAAAIAAFDPAAPDADGYTQTAALIAQAMDPTYAPADEYEADTLAVRFMAEAGYDPRALIDAIEILESAEGGRSAFFATRPPLDQRLERVRRAIEAIFPDGVPRGRVK